MLEKKLFGIPSPGLLHVANRPLSQPDVLIETMAHKDIREQFGFQYTEDIIVEAERKLQAVETTDEYISKIKHRLMNPLNDSLVVCYIHKDVGYGVFTQQVIECGDVIGVYAGQWSKQKQSGPYCLGHMNAQSIGGITRFIQHMPWHKQQIIAEIKQAVDWEALHKQAFIFARADDTLNSMSFSEAKARLLEDVQAYIQYNPKESSLSERLGHEQHPIAFANTVFTGFNYRQLPLFCVIATRRIEKNEQLGASYGLNYWREAGYEPLYFDNQTGEVSRQRVRWMRILIRVGLFWGTLVVGLKTWLICFGS